MPPSLNARNEKRNISYLGSCCPILSIYSKWKFKSFIVSVIRLLFLLMGCFFIYLFIYLKRVCFLKISSKEKVSFLLKNNYGNISAN